MEQNSNSFGKREWVFLLSILLVIFMEGTEESIQAPLFPPEAEKKGVNATIYGAILGFTPFIGFLSVPVTSVLLLKELLNLRLCFLTFAFSKGIFYILYGLLDLAPSSSLFIALGFLWHGIEGFAFGTMISIYILICLVFPTRIGMVTGFLAPATVIGSSLGPIYGEAIFGVLGYMTTFLVTGGIYLVVAACLCAVLPEVPKIPHITSTNTIFEYFWQILSIPATIYSVALLITGFGTSYMYAILENHLEQFKLTNIEIGLMFVCNSLPQLLSPFWGHVADRTGSGPVVGLAGGIVAVLGIAGLGPITILPLQSSVGLTAVGLILFALGQGGLASCNFSNIVRATSDVKVDGANTFTQAIFVSVFQMVATAFGSFAGYFLAGVMFDAYGFGSAMNLLCLLYGFMSLLLLYQALAAVCHARVSNVSIVQESSDYGSNQESSSLLNQTRTQSMM